MAKFRDVCIFHGSDRIETGCFTPNGNVCATGGRGRVVTLWDTDGGEVIMKMPPHLTTVTALQFNSDNTLLASGDFDGSLKIWDLREARLMRSLDGHRLVICSIDFYPNSDASISATGSREGRAKLWDIRRKGFFRTFGRKGGPAVNNVSFSPDGRLIAIGDEDGLKLWDVNNESSPLMSYSFQNCSNARFHHRDMILSATSNNSENSNIHFIDLESLNEESNCVLSKSKIQSLQFHPDRQAIIAATDTTLTVSGWDPPGIYDTILCNLGRVHSAKSFSDYYLIMTDDERASGKITQIDLSKVQLSRPETPHSSGLRKTFDQSRPDTMESKLNGDSPRSDEGHESRVEIADMNKFAALFSEQKIERSKSNLEEQNIKRKDFNKALNPRQSMEALIKQPMIRERSAPPSAPRQSAGDPYSQFAEPYRSNKPPSHPRSDSVTSRSTSAYSRASNSRYGSAASSGRPSAGDHNPMRDQKFNAGSILSSSIYDLLKHRRENLESATLHWPNVDSVIDSAFALGDQSTVIDLLNVINRRVPIWSLSICAKLMSQSEQCSLLQMLLTKELTVFETVLDSILLIARHFSPMIFENMAKPVSASCDLQGEERKNRAIVCYESLRQAKSLLQNRSQTEGHLNGKIREILIELSNY